MSRIYISPEGRIEGAEENCTSPISANYMNDKTSRSIDPRLAPSRSMRACSVDCCQAEFVSLSMHSYTVITTNNELIHLAPGEAD